MQPLYLFKKVFYFVYGYTRCYVYVTSQIEPKIPTNHDEGLDGPVHSVLFDRFHYYCVLRVFIVSHMSALFQSHFV